MKNQLFDLINNITDSYYMIENYVKDETGKEIKIIQYSDGKNGNVAFTVVPTSKHESYVAVDLKGRNKPFCYAVTDYGRVYIVENDDIVMFGLKNPNDMIAGIMKFLSKSNDNIRAISSFYGANRPTEIVLLSGQNSYLIGEIFTDRSTIQQFEYAFFKYRNINLKIVPLSEKEFKLETSLYLNMLNEELSINENNL